MSNFAIKLIHCRSKWFVRSIPLLFRHQYIPVVSNVQYVNLSTSFQYSNKIVASTTSTSNDSASAKLFTSKWIRNSLFFVACGFGIYLFKKEHYASCHHKETEEVEKWKGVKIKLFQYQTCPFCSKARFFLQAYNIPFEIIEVHPIFKKETKFAKSKKVPVVLFEKDGEALEIADSSFIISVLASYMINGDKSVNELMKLYPHSKEIDEHDGKEKDVILNKYWLIHEEETAHPGLDPRQEEAEWRRWADEHLVHIISPNVYRTYREAFQAFDHHVKQGKFNGTWEGVVAKYFGSTAMWLISKKLKKKYNISEDVRLDLYKACNKWIEAIGKHRKYMGGDKPNLADISVFGILSVMEGLDSFDDLLEHSPIKRWYFNTKKAIEEHNGQKLL